MSIKTFLLNIYNNLKNRLSICIFHIISIYLFIVFFQPLMYLHKYKIGGEVLIFIFIFVLTDLILTLTIFLLEGIIQKLRIPDKITDSTIFKIFLFLGFASEILLFLLIIYAFC